jgi:hypothetical protein
LSTLVSQLLLANTGSRHTECCTCPQRVTMHEEDDERVCLQAERAVDDEKQTETEAVKCNCVVFPLLERGVKAADHKNTQAKGHYVQRFTYMTCPHNDIILLTLPNFK